MTPSQRNIWQINFKPNPSSFLKVIKNYIIFERGGEAQTNTEDYTELVGSTRSRKTK